MTVSTTPGSFGTPKYLEEREKQEAHRLLYVAMTRAEEHLILSYSRGKNQTFELGKDRRENLSTRRTAACP